MLAGSVSSAFVSVQGGEIVQQDVSFGENASFSIRVNGEVVQSGGPNVPSGRPLIPTSPEAPAAPEAAPEAPAEPSGEVEVQETPRERFERRIAEFRARRDQLRQERLSSSSSSSPRRGFSPSAAIGLGDNVGFRP